MSKWAFFSNKIFSRKGKGYGVRGYGVQFIGESTLEILEELKSSAIFRGIFILSDIMLSIWYSYSLQVFFFLDYEINRTEFGKTKELPLKVFKNIRKKYTEFVRQIKVELSLDHVLMLLQCFLLL